MKKIIVSFTVLFLISVGTLLAQLPPHPKGGNDPNSGNTPVGGGASIGGGLIILVSLGMGYASRKIYTLRSESREKILS